MRKSRADKTLKGICISIILSNISKSTAFLVRVIINFINYLITESEVVTGKSQTEALPY